jgi:hypothetical protein
VALVTGGNRGMGLETARQLLLRGYRVALTGRDAEATARSRIGLGELGRRAVSLRMDVADAASIDAARRSIQTQSARSMWSSTTPLYLPGGRGPLGPANDTVPSHAYGRALGPKDLAALLAFLRSL